jgi:uncharacterized protein YndB with AHSA1/START domain
MSEFQSIHVEGHLPFPPARVWKALTNQSLLSQWLMPSDFQPTVGHQFSFKTQPIPAANFDGNIICRVLEVEPERRLKITWGEGSLDTTVLWELAPEGAGTHLSMLHDGFDPKNPVHQFAYEGMSDGWRTGVIPGLTRFLTQQVAQEA